MDTQSFYTRKMLLQYGRQLVSARRLARYESLLGKTPESDQEVLAAQRKSMVERVAREIVDNLIFTGSTNPIVLEVKDALNNLRGEEIIFRYPPGELDVRVFHIGEDGTEIEFIGAEKQEIAGQLWTTALQVVEATMF